MALTAPLSHDVSSTARTLGAQYFQRGFVLLPEANPWMVEAVVRAGKSFDVTMARDEDDAIAAWCDCARCARHDEVCEHIWATLLAAEARGHLGGDRGRAPQYLYITDDDFADAEYDAQPDDWYDDEPEPRRRRAPRAAARSGNAGWKRALAHLRAQLEQGSAHETVLPAGQEIVYLLDVIDSRAEAALVLHVATRQRKKDGTWSKPKSRSFDADEISSIADAADRRALALLQGARETDDGYYPYRGGGSTRYVLSQAQHEIVLPLLCAGGRAFQCSEDLHVELEPLRWDAGGAWDLWLTVSADDAKSRYLLQGELRRGEERLDLQTPQLLLPGLVLWSGQMAPLFEQGVFAWMDLLRERRELSVPAKDRDVLLVELLSLPQLPRLELPDELRFDEARGTPRPCLTIRADRQPGWMRRQNDRLEGQLAFDYEGRAVAADQPGRGIYDAARRLFLVRDTAAERAALARLLTAGFQWRSFDYGGEECLQLASRQLPRAVRQLLAEGWRVEAEGKLYRQATDFQLEVSTGIDWFELHGGARFGAEQVPLPVLLAALKRGDNLVTLGDGSVGMLPEAWLKKYGLLTGCGTPEGDHLRFSRTQVGLLDVLLAEQPEARVDKQFQQARARLHSFQGIAPAEPAAGFTGTLRAYQQEGLGWLHFLRDFRFGGCLADDMGLGKTIQVLALLDGRRALRAEAAGKERPGPSLVVVPRSLIFNWKQEAARFTPQLRVLDHTGIERLQAGPHFDDYDLILTTYGTLRRDIVELKERRFDYAILDEAQAIKNANSQSAKAARLLVADHRLVMSGTPVENHLGELWSLCEFLNPGMLGQAAALRLGEGGLRNPSEESRTLLAKVLRPFLLRRTKAQVARDLPDKTEQTIYCDLEPAQRQLYDELRAHYRASLLTRVDRDGIKKSKIQILEALLRLRQAACHPGLIDKKRAGESSAKLETLIPQLQEVFAEDHKTLVFSQFTSLLAIVKQRLDADKVPYEYLDGRTRDRQERVERFQNDADCKLFLISLKAGGLGLNLTAADYVFLLDPWWNPAVESQAIDRAHRIGQTRPVFAYRLIARDTVEEKVLQLQEQKRALADAIITADNSVIRTLGRDDLELLLS